MKALVMVDLQNDFLTGGAVPAQQGDSILPLANQLQGVFRLVVATQDWHPPRHRSFAATHAGGQPGQVINYKKQTQFLWPTHCIQNSRGAELSPALMMNRVNKVFRKGTDAEVETYSSFFDQDHALATGLHEYLQAKKVTDVYILGLGIEYVVRATVLDALSLGFSTWVIEDACRGFNFQPDDARAAMEEIRQSGATVIQSRDLLEIPKKIPA
jgi:nicotinamidase/pyrazinamidase